MRKLIFHVDVNSAYLSWEATRRVRRGEPDLRLIPSAIGGDRSKRTGIILANVLSFVWINILGISKYIAPLINLIVSVPVNFFMNKLWAYKS